MAASFGVSAAHEPLEIIYNDGDGVGVNDTRTLELPDGKVTTYGEYRKSSIEHVARATALQFNTEVALSWEVEFKSLSGYNALTLGPGIVTGSVLDEYGIIEKDRGVPNTLQASLLKRGTLFPSDISYAKTDFQGGDFVYTDIVESTGQSYFTTIVYHELAHFYGFASAECLECNEDIDGNTSSFSNPSTLSQYLWFNDSNGEISLYDLLSDEKKLEAATSTTDYLLKLNGLSQAVFNDEITSGKQVIGNEVYIEMHSTPDLDGRWDSQVGSHVSDSVLPAQLMRSSAIATQDLGVAAFALCDMGWCRNEGQVVDLYTNVELDENASSEESTFVDITIGSNTDAVIGQVEAKFRLDEAYTDLTMVGQVAGCEQDGYSISCSLTLNEREEKTFTLSFGSISESGFKVDGEVYTNEFHVDRNGFNNIADTVIEKPESEDDGDGDTGGDTSTDPIVVKPESGGSSGGSMSLWMILLGLVGVAVRHKK